MMHRIVGFLDFVHPLIFKKAKNMTFQKLYLPLSLGEAKDGEGGVTKPTQLGHLERVSLNDWIIQYKKTTTYICLIPGYVSRIQQIMH
jgi:hypothetical protein